MAADDLRGRRAVGLIQSPSGTGRKTERDVVGGAEAAEAAAEAAEAAVAAEMMCWPVEEGRGGMALGDWS